MKPISFTSQIRYWNPEKASGLAVADIPEALHAELGGLRQQHVEGTIGGQAFASNVMPAGGGRLALSVNKAMMKSVGVGIGDEVAFEISQVGRN
jgi:Domain of unknown function (DUF1905)